MYRRLKKEPAAITPMVVDIANPSPGIGYMNTERPPFLDRARPDCVLALAVLHHLLVGANLPMAAARDLFAVPGPETSHPGIRAHQRCHVPETDRISRQSI